MVEAISGVMLNTSQSQHLLDVLGKHGLRSIQRRLEGTHAAHLDSRRLAGR
jgi:hypothetical protein